MTSTVLAKTLKTFLKSKQSESCTINARPTHGRESWETSMEFSLTVKAHGEPNGITRQLAVPGFNTGDNGNNGKLQCDRGYWHLGSIDSLRSVVEFIPADSTVQFKVYSGAGNTCLTDDAGLAIDHLYLVVETKQGKRHQFLIDTANNKKDSTWRFINDI